MRHEWLATWKRLMRRISSVLEKKEWGERWSVKTSYLGPTEEHNLDEVRPDQV